MLFEDSEEMRGFQLSVHSQHQHLAREHCEVNTLYLSEFWFVSPHLRLQISLISCRLKNLKKRRASSCPFLHNTNNLSQKEHEVNTPYLHEFCFVLSHLRLHLTLTSCSLKNPKRRETSNHPIIRNTDMLF
jgi:hypothetical protein